MVLCIKVEFAHCIWVPLQLLMFSLFALVSLSVTSPLLASAANVVQDWTLATAEFAPDGFTRTAALVNGVYPGPLLKANKGDTVTVNVHNKLNDPGIRKSTSIVSHIFFH